MVEALRVSHGDVVFDALAVVGMFMTGRAGMNVPYVALIDGKAERYIPDAATHVRTLLAKRDNLSASEKLEYVETMRRLYEQRYVPGDCATPAFFQEQLSAVIGVPSSIEVKIAA
jgi:hypothetical protein